MKAIYQEDYADSRPQMYDKKSREEKARRMVLLLANYYRPAKINKLKLLDVGASTGIISNYLSHYFAHVTACDIDANAINYAKKNFKKGNLKYQVADAMNLPFKSNSFDVVICAHVYEHVPDSTKLFSEIKRVLTPGGVCYLAAGNRLWPIEFHYNLPFLSWLPKHLADIYIRLAGKADKYYETQLSYWELRKMISKYKFRIVDCTGMVLRQPKKFGYNNIIKFPLSPIAYVLSPLAKHFTPTFFWLLVKK